MTTLDFDKLGLFYLGRTRDLGSSERSPQPVLYDSKDLVTHAIAIGMTGSGKTGLCLGLLEEAALDGIPAIAIDPKGDLSNILLTFPDLAPADFLPWINPDEARTKNLSHEDWAGQQAALWKRGLGDWGQDGARIRRLQAAAEFAIYTPGSTAGLPLSILRSLDVPPPQILDDDELLNNRIASIVTSLLVLIGVAADPIKSREHILLSTILSASWKAGQDLELSALIQQIQSPPVSRIGVIDVESFFPASDRFELGMRLNNLLASPGSKAWTTGAPLNIGQLLHRADGKPRISIMSIAHLSDAERMFFVSILLTQVIGWMRTQPGTDSLRAVLYMDEIAGYFPPVANPPSKAPLLMLLKQARAFGLGVVLATQNPVDLDYKGLANIGTWFLGRLQTEQDKAHVIEGIEGVATSGPALDRKSIDETLSKLKSRIFLMRNVHEDHPVIFETRWTMSYLRGPLTREQIRTLMDPLRSTGAPKPDTATAPAAQLSTAAATSQPRMTGAGASPPVLPPDVKQFFLPLGQSGAQQIAFEPRVLAVASLRFVDPKQGIDDARDAIFSARLGDGPVPVSWDDASATNLRLDQLATDPPQAGEFAELPRGALSKKNYDAWSKDFVRWASQSQSLNLFKSVRANLLSKPGESEGDFRVRLRQASRELRDREVVRLRQKYAARIASQTERVRRSELSQARESEQASQQKLQTALSFGATIFGALLGRKTLSASTLGRATTAARGVGRSMKESEDVARASQNVQSERDKLGSLETELSAEIAALDRRRRVH